MSDPSQGSGGGTRDHTNLLNRDVIGQHPSQSVGGLSPDALNVGDLGSYWNNIGIAAGGVIRGITYLGNGIAVFGVDNGHIWRTVDYGSTWTDLGNLNSGSIIFTFSYVGNGIVICSGDNGHVLRSTDFGVNWVDLGALIGTSVFCSAFAGNIPGFGSGVVLIGDTNGHVWQSTNNGLTYADTGLWSAGFIDSITYLDSRIVIFTDNAGHIFRSTNSGTTWTDLGDFSTSSAFGSVYLGNGVALVSTGIGHILRSTDFGLTWTDLGVMSNAGSAVQTLAYLGNGAVLFGDFNGHLFKSLDYGVTWSDKGQISFNVIRSIAYLNNGVTVVGDNGGAINISTTSFRLDEARVTVHSDLVNRNTVGAHTAQAVGILSSSAINASDVGKNWKNQGTFSTGNFFTVSFIGNGISIAGDSVGHVFRSFDYGFQFFDLGDITSADPILSSTYVGNGIVVFCTNSAFVWRSTDFGATWASLGNQGVDNGLSYLGNGIVIGGGGVGIHRSINFGATWLNLGVAPGVLSTVYLGNSIAIASDSGGNIWRSTDYGATWINVAPALSGANIWTVGNLSNGVALAVDNLGVIYRSSDFGATWVTIGKPVGTGTNGRGISYLGNGIAIYTDSAGNVVRSTDYGLTWAIAFTIGSFTTSTACSSDGVVLAVDFAGRLFKSDVSFKIDEARATVHNDLTNKNVSGAAAHTAQAVGVLSPSALMFQDIGRRWVDLGDQTVGVAVTSSLYIGSGIALIGDNNGVLYRSFDNGFAWASLTAPSTFRINSMAYVGDGIILVGDANGEIFRSTIYGQESPFLLEASVGVLRAMVVSYFGDGICLAGDSNGNIYRSTNFGSFWAPIAGNPITGNAINVIVNIEGSLGVFVDGLGASGKIYLTLDAGLTWGLVLTTASPFESAVYVGNGVVFAGQANGHMWRSVDFGTTWKDLGVVAFGGIRTLIYLGNGITMFTDSGNPGHISLAYGPDQQWNDFNGDITGVGAPLITSSYIGNGVVITADNVGHVFRSDVSVKVEEAVQNIPDRTVTFLTGVYGVNFNHKIDIGNAVAGAITFNLPAALIYTGRVFTFKKIDATANTVTITPGAGDSIDGNPAGYVINVQYQSVTIVSDGTTNWWIV